MKIKNININIKKLTPTLSIGATAAAATPVIIYQCQNSNSVVVNNYVGDKNMQSVVKTQQNSSTIIKIKGLPDLNMNSGESLGTAWKQYLLQAPNDGRWIQNEKELLRSSTTSSQGIKSELFKEAKKKNPKQ